MFADEGASITLFDSLDALAIGLEVSVDRGDPFLVALGPSLVEEGKLAGAHVASTVSRCGAGWRLRGMRLGLSSRALRGAPPP